MPVLILKRALVLAAALLVGCGGSDDVPTTSDGGVTDTTAKATVGSVAVKVLYAGSKKGQLAVGAFTEAEPKTRPPVSFDTSKTPSFPYSSTLTDLEPGRYWIYAILDLEPFNGTAGRPSAEDLQGHSAAIDVVAGETKSVEVTIDDGPADAGADTTADAGTD